MPVVRHITLHAKIVFLPRGQESRNYSIEWTQARLSRLDERNARIFGSIADEGALQVAPLIRFSVFRSVCAMWSSLR